MNVFVYKKSIECRAEIGDWTDKGIQVESADFSGRISHEDDIPDDCLDDALSCYVRDVIINNRPLDENETRGLRDHHVIYTMVVDGDKLAIYYKDGRLFEECTEEELRCPSYSQRPERLAYFLKHWGPKKVTIRGCRIGHSAGVFGGVLVDEIPDSDLDSLMKLSSKKNLTITFEVGS